MHILKHGVIGKCVGGIQPPAKPYDKPIILFFYHFVFSLPKGIQFGRKEISEVAERRKHDIKTFLDGLFGLPESVAHCDLVYTFFHPILRDQEEANIRQRKMKGNINIDFTVLLSNPYYSLSMITLTYTFCINR